MDRRARLIGIACGFLSPVSFLVLYCIAMLNDPGYTFFENYLSDLGVGPAAWAFNSAVILAGVLAMPFATTAFVPTFGRRRLSLAGSATLLVACAFLILVGVFTEDYGDLHLVVSIGFFLTLLMAFGLIAEAAYRTRALGWPGKWFSVGVFVVGTILLVNGTDPWVETVAVLAAVVWLLVMSLLVLMKELGMRLPGASTPLDVP
jgi:hypothetical membrane protein